MDFRTFKIIHNRLNNLTDNMLELLDEFNVSVKDKDTYEILNDINNTIDGFKIQMSNMDDEYKIAYINTQINMLLQCIGGTRNINKLKKFYGLEI